MLIKLPKKTISLFAVSLISVGLLTACGSSDDNKKTVIDVVNQSPQITSSPITMIDNNTAYSYQLTINDPDDANDGSQITFMLNTAPDGMTVSNTGLIEWQPQLTQSQIIDISVTAQDGGEDSSTPANQDFSVDVTNYLTLNGRSVDYFTGQEIAEVEISVTNGTEIIGQATSATSGEYSVNIDDRDFSARTTLIAESDEYVRSAKTLTTEQLTQSALLTLLPVQSSVTFDSTLVQSLMIAQQVIVELPASSLVQSNGAAAEGDVTARMTIIDPSIDIALMPGDMQTESEGVLAPIQSFGAIDVVFTDAADNILDLAQEQSATVNIPVAANIAQPPATMPLYYYDDAAGLWVEEGEATLVTENGQQFYRGTVEHFSTWNADSLYESINITGTVVDADGNPVANAVLVATGRDYNGSSITTSDAQGQFVIAARPGSEILLSATNGQQSRTLSINTDDEDQTLEQPLVLSPATSTITLTWNLNPGDLDSHFFGPANEDGSRFHIYYSDKTATVNDEVIYLDVDDVSSFGPEIITIPSFPLAGRYQYIVHHYGGSSDIQASPARVQVNLESDITIYGPPEGTAAEYWHVFDFVVDNEGTVTIETVNQWLDDLSELDNSEEEAPQGQRAPSKSMLKSAISNKYYSKG